MSKAIIPMRDDRKTGYKFLQPIKGGGYHPGEDLNSGNSAYADLGKPVKAMMTGKIIYAKYSGRGWGNIVVILHEKEQIWSRYAHFSQIFVKNGDIVMTGDIIGHCGKSGTASPHLHWEVIKKELPRWTFYPNGWSTTKILEHWENPYKFVERMNEQFVPEWMKESVDKAISKMIEADWSDPNEVIGDATIETMLVKMGALSKQEGNLTKGRFVVALDRLGLLD